MPTATRWSNASGGDWTVDGNWSAGQPTSITDATLGPLSSYYTVTLTGSGAANSLTIDSTAALSISTLSGNPSANLAVDGNLSNAGRLYVDAYISPTGGSSLSVGGTLSNSYYTQIGNPSLSGPTTVTAAALANTGGLFLYGGTGTNNNQATLDILSAAPSVLTGHIELTGRALLEFSGGGSFTSIASTSNVYQAGLFLHGADAFVGGPGSNSALSGLQSNAGSFVLDDGAQVHIQGSFSNSGYLYVDANYSNTGGSSLTFDGALSNRGTLQIGNPNANFASTVSAAALILSDTSRIYLSGGSGTT